MKETVLINGEEKEIVVDRDYLIQSIKEPNVAIVKSYQANLMTPYANVLSDDEINIIIDYIETLK